MGSHEAAQPDAHRDAAEHEIEHMAAAIGLGEMAGEAVAPAIGFLEQVDRRFGALVASRWSVPITPPFLVDLRGAIGIAKISGLEAFDAGHRQQQRIFDPDAIAAPPFVRELLEKSSFLRIGRRQQLGGQRLLDVRRVERPLGGRLQPFRHHHRIERAPHDPRGSRSVDGQVDHRRAPFDRQLDDFGGAAAAAGRKAVPDRDQDVAMGDRRAAGHHIGLGLAGRARREARERVPLCQAVNQTVSRPRPG